MPAKRKISLALQGGGAHGAFTWGVLDRLLEDENIEIEAISGASAGAINGAFLVQGMARGGRAEARKELADFWSAVSTSGGSGYSHFNIIQETLGLWNIDSSPLANLLESLKQMVSPYHLHPPGFHPLGNLIKTMIDPTVIRDHDQIKLFVSAANVSQGSLRLFRNHEISHAALLATSCLPELSHAVEIDGESYWDGGFIANPALFPLVEEASAKEVVLVVINPLRCPDIPLSAEGIRARSRQIMLNAPLIRELDHFERQCGCRGQPKHFSIICEEDEMHRIGQLSKYQVLWGFIRWLRDLGRGAAERWLEGQGAAAECRDTESGQLNWRVA